MIRGGLGMFYDPTGPQPIFEILPYDGHHLLQYLITNPLYPDPNAVGPPSSVTLDPAVKLPYLLQFGATVESVHNRPARRTEASSARRRQ